MQLAPVTGASRAHTLKPDASRVRYLYARAPSKLEGVGAPIGPRHQGCGYARLRTLEQRLLRLAKRIGCTAPISAAQCRWPACHAICSAMKVEMK